MTVFPAPVCGASPDPLEISLSPRCFKNSKAALLSLVLGLMFSPAVLAQIPSSFPIDIVPGPAPQPVSVDSRVRLVYELHITNFAPWEIQLTQIDVLGETATPLFSYPQGALEPLVVPIERLFVSAAPSSPTGGSHISVLVGNGRSVVVFLDLAFNPGVSLPAELRHRISFSYTGKEGVVIQKSVTAAGVPVVREPVPVLRPPLRGSAWVAFNAFGDESHRRAFNPVDGRIRIAERFAIDWMLLGPGVNLFHGDAKSNANYYGYGAEVLAVAEGRVVDRKDGLPENLAATDRSSRIVTLENIVGNSLTLDLGHRHFALYAHLQPGSLTVGLGEKVKAGQVLARLGNSGNSDAPHLHFQLTDANSPLGAEGIPYVLDAFKQFGVVADRDPLLNDGKSWHPEAHENPTTHRQEFPNNNAVVTFP